MAAAKTNFPPNLKDRREKRRNKNHCQTCDTAISLKEQYTVVNDLDNGKVNKRKNAARKGAENLNHYCDDCADKRVKRGEYFIQRRADGTWGQPLNGKAKPKKAAKKTAAKAKPKAVKPKPKKAQKAKRVAKPKAEPKAAASKGDDTPF